MRFVKTLQKRHLADLDQQQEQTHPQVNSYEPTINKSNYPPDQPTVHPHQQIYRSKPSTNNNVELFIKSTGKEFFNP